MLLVHQEGIVKVGEVIRYTLTYTPTEDRILPTPSQLHVRIKNTTAIPYRAAYLVGPYTIYAAAYPSNFTPHKAVEDSQRYGVPQFEPNLKAGGHFHAKLTIPEDIKESGDRAWFHGDEGGEPKSVTWVIEISSQILFSQNANVQYELLVARDERSLDTGFAALASRGHGEPGKAADLIQFQVEGPGKNPAPKGIYSKAVDLVAQDTAQLWNTPPLPRWADQDHDQNRNTANKRMSWKVPLRRSMSANRTKESPIEPEQPKRKRIHLVILTHGLHSNVGADMLYMKESIDATVKQAREDARKRKAEIRKHAAVPQSKQLSEQVSEGSTQETSTAPLSGGQEDLPESDETQDDDDDEQVIVRGFSGNVTRTEKGIQYLGKRLAKFILTMTYPDQPYLPVAKSISRRLTESMSPTTSSADRGKVKAAHTGSSIHKTVGDREKLPYTFTSISFIGHSLGGLIQLYAIGYIRKHSPDFFDQIKPINFVALAAPLLGLSNENPLYVRFALDFGLVGRTGQDLGLTWRAPTIARSGWSAMISGFAGGGQEKQQEKPAEDPRSKPLLRILPSGPAHHVLKQFRNRTVYANVVNDGIVPLRTSCLLFLDWRGLDRVDNARRENGLISTMAQFGWNELMGAKAVSQEPPTPGAVEKGLGNDLYQGDATPRDTSKEREDSSDSKEDAPAAHQFLSNPLPDDQTSSVDVAALSSSSDTYNSTRRPSPSRFEGFFNFFRTSSPKRAASPPEQHHKDPHIANHKISRKTTERMRRAQTVRTPNGKVVSIDTPKQTPARPPATRGDSMLSTSNPDSGPPPKTSIFEAASDIINPPIPAQSWIIDPSTRKRSIFHDRIYHPEDIPPPPQKKNRSVSSLVRSVSSDSLRPRSNGTLPSSTTSSPQASPPLPRRRSHQPTPSTSSSLNSPPASTPNEKHAKNDRRTRTDLELGPQTDTSAMSVEEKIARAYHRDLSWRKVLVRLEPDAHNNLIVRRMFANAYGWEVVRHLCETHFAETYAAKTGDSEEESSERADRPEEWRGRPETPSKEPEATGATLDPSRTVPRVGEGQSVSEGAGEHDASKDAALTTERARRARTTSELREASDTVPEMASRGPSFRSTSSRHGSLVDRRVEKRNSLGFNDDEFFERDGTDDEWDGEGEMAVSR